MILEEFLSISMSDFREALWKNSTNLKETLLKYVGRGLQKREMLDFLTRDFPLYEWSVRMINEKSFLCPEKDRGMIFKNIMALWKAFRGIQVWESFKNEQKN